MPFLTAENHAWRERARDVADRVVRPLAAKYDREQTYPWEIKDAIAEAGLLTVWIPKEYGGAGGGPEPGTAARARRGRGLPGLR